MYLYLYLMVAILGMLWGVLAILVARYFLRRRHIYQDLADHRQHITQGHEPRIAALLAPEDLRADFERDRLVRVPHFLTEMSLEKLRRECDDGHPHLDRSYLPMHKKGGTLGYERLHRYAPACLAFYHSEEVRKWVSAVVGCELMPTADHDQSSCSILYYDQPGDHINWHFDHNFYKGRHFTALISVVNRAACGLVSQGRFMRKTRDGDTVHYDTSENTFVLFEGASVLHRASPVAEDEQRIMLSMTFCTDPRIGWGQELVRRFKDTAYYGPRVLVD